MKKHKQILLISLILILFTIICYFARLQQGSHDSMNRFLYELSKGNQIRSIIAGIVIWGLGLGTLINMNVYSNDVKMLFLLSVPTGIAFWCVLSILVLICGIKYCAVTMLFVCIATEILIAMERKRKKSVLRYNWTDIAQFCVLALGIICVCSIGLAYASKTGDTVMYIDLLGKAFVIEGKFSSHFERIFLSTGIGLAPLSSLTYMLGSDNIYIIHSLNFVNFFFLFWYCLYKKIASSIYNKYAKISSFICTIFTIALPPVLYLFGWIASNVYIMCYLVILVILLLDEQNSSDMGDSELIGLLCVFFIYLRSDAAITLSCLILCAVIGEISTKKMICSVILPSILAMILYYGKIYMVLGPQGDGLFLDVKTISAMFILLISLLIYYAFFRNKRFLFFQRYIVIIVIMTMLFTMVVLFLSDFETFSYCMDIYNINTTDISPQGGFWGVTAAFIPMLLLLTHIQSDEKIKNIEFLAMVLVLSNMIMGPLRTYLGVAPRIGAGDSFNRAFISYLPLALWAIYDRIFLSINNKNNDNICKIH